MGGAAELAGAASGLVSPAWLAARPGVGPAPVGWNFWPEPVAKSFARRFEADRYRTEIQRSLATGGYIDPAMSRVMVGEWSKTWLAQTQVKPSTATRYEGLLRVHILPTWQRVPLQAVTHVDVGRWVNELVDKGLAPSTVRQAHRVLSLLLSLAVKDNRIARNPAAGVRLPRVSAAQKRFLTHEQVSSLADAAGDHGLVIEVLAYTGLRFGELAALRVRHVDLVKRRLQVVESVTEVRGHVIFGSPKTHAARSVAIPSFILEQIATRLEGQPADAFVFPAPRGGVLRLRNWRREVVRSRSTSRRTRRHHPTRPAAYRRQPRHSRRSQHQGSTTDARTPIRRHDP